MNKKAIYSLVLFVMVSCFTIGFYVFCMPVTEQPTLAVSIQPQRYFLEKIVGDKYEVVCMLSQGSNPESYEPSFNHLVALENCDAYFCVGHIGFELAMLPQVKNNNPDLRIIDCSKGIKLLQGTHSGVLAQKENTNNREGHSHGHEVDPHVWTSVVNAKIIAQNLYITMLEIDGKNKKYYTQNYNALMAELSELERELKDRLSSHVGSAFAVWHPSLSYFARDYGLVQIAMENEGKEVPAKVLKEEIDLARNKNVRVLFYQREFDSRQIQTINEQLGAEMVEIDPMNYEWSNEMRKIAYALTAEE